MAGSLLLLLDDIATVLDDVATMTKVAVTKTAGVIGDDLALNAKQIVGVATKREIPVVLAVARGSVINKAILVPAALVISWLAPWLIAPLLLVGGLYLCYEGAEKLLHSAHTGTSPGHTPTAAVDERQKIAGAIRTDFILSAEIIVIALGVVAASSLLTRVGVLVAVAVGMTVGVYGLVAGIVKLDDLGMFLAGGTSGPLRRLGIGILTATPVLMRLLSIGGTAAMFLVGGGIVAHAVPPVHAALHDVAAGLGPPGDHGASWITAVVGLAGEGLVGLAAGFAAALAAQAGRRVWGTVRGA